MSEASDERKRRIAELEAMAARMEEQIDLAEKTIRESRKNLAAIREHIKTAMGGDNGDDTD
jgi:predicted  nucleic acid-binding Zn-ribbon protein